MSLESATDDALESNPHAPTDGDGEQGNAYDSPERKIASVKGRLEELKSELAQSIERAEESGCFLGVQLVRRDGWVEDLQGDIDEFAPLPTNEWNDLNSLLGWLDQGSEMARRSGIAILDRCLAHYQSQFAE